MKKWVFNIVIIICILIFLGSGLYLLRYFLSARQTENELDELIRLKTESLEQEDDGDEIRTPEGKKILKKYKISSSENAKQKK